jgi:membrane-bound serine protease (ClpP class)
MKGSAEGTLVTRWHHGSVRILRMAALLMIALAIVPSARAAGSNDVVSLRLEGVVDPFESSYLTSQIQAAGRDGAAAVLITIDTPGGLDSSMRDIIKSILNSPVPVVCYVSPEGARAASAGTFILTACDVAAMAPGTNVGAASPVGVSGAIEEQKVKSDAAAFIRSLAQQKHRNPDWAASAVTQAASASADEALRLHAIDLIAVDQSALLGRIDGRTITKNGSSITLHTSGAQIEERSMPIASNILHHLLTPDLAFLFFYLGIGLLIAEVLHPGISIPGVLGVLSLIAAGTAFGMLPVQLVGIVLLVASAVFLLLELKHPGITFAGIAGIVTLVLGGLLLFNNNVPGVGVSPWTIIPVAVVMSLYLVFVVPAVVRARKLPARAGSERFIGAEGVATTAIRPRGTARVSSELWTVDSVAGPIPKGARVRVVGAEGLRLKVEPVLDASKTPATPLETTGG